MNLERVLRGIIGVFVLAGAALTTFQSPKWIYFTVLLGVMVAQSAFTDRCPMIWLLEKVGLRRCEVADHPKSKVALAQSTRQAAR